MCRKNRDIVNEYLRDRADTIEGHSQAKTWNLIKKLAPKNTLDPPAGKKDNEGNLITDRVALEKLYLDTYRSRLKPNPISDEVSELGISANRYTNALMAL